MIVILAPYGRNEVTAAALRLANLADAAGLPVRYVACGRHAGGVDAVWDRRVLSAADDFYSACEGATHCVWFAVSGRRKDTDFVAKNVVHTLVPSVHTLTKGDVPCLPRYARVVCTGKAAKALLLKNVYGGKDPSGETGQVLTWCSWDAGLQPCRREGFVASGGVRVLVHCDASSIDECGMLTLQAVDQLLELVDGSRLTLLCTKTWGKRDRVRLRGLVAKWAGRLQVVYQTTWQEQTSLFHTHDWCVLPGLRYDFGITAERAMSCGLPVVAYDTPPVSERVTDGVNGVLVPCELWSNWVEAAWAVASGTAFVDKTLDALADPQVLLKLQRFEAAGRIDSFRKFWLAQWDAA